MTDHLKPNVIVKELQNEPGAIALINEFKDHTDPKYIGPGTWNVIHRIGFDASTHEQQTSFITLMREICNKFPCNICKSHCLEYITNHPLEEYLDVLVDIDGNKIALGMFVWSWKFHNAVNFRTKKPIMSWDTAYNLYSQSESLICSKNCLDAEGVSPDGVEHASSTVPNVPEPVTKASLIPTFNPKSFQMISVRQSRGVGTY